MEDDASCSNLHQDECDIIIQLKHAIFQFLEENENSDSKENEYNDLKRYIKWGYNDTRTLDIFLNLAIFVGQIDDEINIFIVANASN